MFFLSSVSSSYPESAGWNDLGASHVVCNVLGSISCSYPESAGWNDLGASHVVCWLLAVAAVGVDMVQQGFLCLIFIDVGTTTVANEP